MQFTLDTAYEGAAITIRYDQSSSAELHINGRLREKVSSDQTNITLRLSSSVQTGYEYHELIEAIVQFNRSTIEVNLFASGISIANAMQLRAAAVKHSQDCI